MLSELTRLHIKSTERLIGARLNSRTSQEWLKLALTYSRWSERDSELYFKAATLAETLEGEQCST